MYSVNSFNFGTRNLFVVNPGPGFSSFRVDYLFLDHTVDKFQRLYHRPSDGLLKRMLNLQNLPCSLYYTHGTTNANHNLPDYLINS